MYECFSSISGRCCAVPLFHHIVTFLQSPVDFWRTRGGHQNSRRGQGMVRINRPPNNNPSSANRPHSPMDNSFLTNDVGHHSTTMATIITNDGDVTNELIQLSEAGNWSNCNKNPALEERCGTIENENNITQGKELSTSQLTVTSTKSGDHKTLVLVPSENNSQVTENAPNNRINGSLV